MFCTPSSVWCFFDQLAFFTLFSFQEFFFVIYVSSSNEKLFSTNNFSERKRNFCGLERFRAPGESNSCLRFGVPASKPLNDRNASLLCLNFHFKLNATLRMYKSSVEEVTLRLLSTEMALLARLQDAITSLHSL